MPCIRLFEHSLTQKAMLVPSDPRLGVNYVRPGVTFLVSA